MHLRTDKESRVLLEEAERTRPVSSRGQRMLAWLDAFEGHIDRAVRRADAILARAPNSEEVRFFRADFAYILDAPDLERWLQPLLERSPSNRGWVAISHRLKYAHALQKRGEAVKAMALVDEADRVARAALNPQPDAMELRVELAAVSALRQDHGAALDWLRKAHEGGYLNYSFLERDPILLGRLGTNPRFVQLLDRMRSDVAAQRERVRARGLLDLTALLGRASR
jgi:hypothetical protein